MDWRGLREVRQQLSTNGLSLTEILVHLKIHYYTNVRWKYNGLEMDLPINFGDQYRYWTHALRESKRLVIALLHPLIMLRSSTKRKVPH